MPNNTDEIMPAEFSVVMGHAAELIMSSPYIRYIDNSGIRRISRAAALQYTRDAQNARMHGWFIYLDGTMSGRILHL